MAAKRPTGRLELNKRNLEMTSRRDIQSEITDKIIELIEVHGANWTKPFADLAGTPTNALTGNKYRGLNAFWLGLMGKAYVATYKQWAELGAQVRKGEKGIGISVPMVIKDKATDKVKGTWFKAGFLHTFTFLAMAFLLVNPPLGDIVAPQLADKWVLVQNEGDEFNFSKGSSESGTITWEVQQDGKLTGDIWLLFGLADNVNVEGAEVTVQLTNNGGVSELASDANFWADNSEVISNATGNVSDTQSSSILMPHGQLDQDFAILLGSNLAVGEHRITVTIIEQGDPWENSRVYTWVLKVVEQLPEVPAS